MVRVAIRMVDMLYVVAVFVMLLNMVRGLIMTMAVAVAMVLAMVMAVVVAELLSGRGQFMISEVISSLSEFQTSTVTDVIMTKTAQINLLSMSDEWLVVEVMFEVESMTAEVKMFIKIVMVFEDPLVLLDWLRHVDNLRPSFVMVMFDDGPMVVVNRYRHGDGLRDCNYSDLRWRRRRRR